MTGLAAEDLHARLDAVPFHAGWGLRLELRDGGVTITTHAPTMLARGEGMTMLHGGAVAGLLDTAMTFAVMATTGRLWTTVDLRVDYLRPAPLGAITVHGHTIHAGRSLGRARAELFSEPGRACAIAVSTLAWREAPAASGH